MMGLFLLVIFTQATRAGNNSKAETFPLGRREGAAVRTLVAVARALAGGKELSQDTGWGTRQLPSGMQRRMECPHW